MGSTPCTMAVVADSEANELRLREIRNIWPMATIAILKNALDLLDVFDAIRHAGTSEDGVETAVAAAERVRDAATLLRHGEKHRVSEMPDAHVAIDPVTRAIFAKAERIAGVHSNVLITGKSGTGKEVVARHIYRHSARRGFKFIPVNCGCLPDSLIESELFGYKKGAFTGALFDHKGLIEEAERGVLFLDEIGDMPLLAQVRLLRFLDSGEVRAVGDTHVRHVDVRIIAASNKDLPAAIRQKQFREDLYFRLNVMSLELPPLRERRRDIVPLVNQHARHAAAKFGLSVPTMSEEAMSLLLHYDWPGNVRELQNAVEQALVQTLGQTITPEDLPSAIRSGAHAVTAGDWLDRTQTEREQILLTLQRHDGNQTKSAAELGISRQTLWRRMRRLEISVEGDGRDGLPSEDGLETAM